MFYFPCNTISNHHKLTSSALTLPPKRDLLLCFMKCYHHFRLVHKRLTKTGSGIPVLRLFRFLCCVTWFNHFHQRHRNSLKRGEGVGACCKNLAKPTAPPGWNATLHSNKGTLRIQLHQHPSYLWCCRRNINSSWLLWIVWTTLKRQNAPTVPVSAAAGACRADWNAGWTTRDSYSDRGLTLVVVLALEG